MRTGTDVLQAVLWAARTNKIELNLPAEGGGRLHIRIDPRLRDPEVALAAARVVPGLPLPGPGERLTVVYDRIAREAAALLWQGNRARTVAAPQEDDRPASHVRILQTVLDITR